jgi:hypothetical protein
MHRLRSMRDTSAACSVCTGSTFSPDLRTDVAQLQSEEFGVCDAKLGAEVCDGKQKGSLSDYNDGLPFPS